MPKKSSRSSGALVYKWNRDGYVDPYWHWIEGEKRDSQGRLRWWPLYCFRLNDADRAAATLNYIRGEKSAADRKRDRLEEFQDFRLHRAGEFLKATTSMLEARNLVGGYALACSLREYTAQRSK